MGMGWQESEPSIYCWHPLKNEIRGVYFLSAPLKKKIRRVQILSASLKKKSEPSLA